MAFVHVIVHEQCSPSAAADFSKSCYTLYYAALYVKTQSGWNNILLCLESINNLGTTCFFID